MSDFLDFLKWLEAEAIPHSMAIFRNDKEKKGVFVDIADSRRFQIPGLGPKIIDHLGKNCPDLKWQSCGYFTTLLVMTK